ncbi:HAD-IA family hydrolase [Paraburkholderia sp. EG287B]|uniref:HAD-IA family hydrolase n=1 Tax=unclassified Paraburkholderia TaxID=2615204 RepID=UPI0034D261B4
MQVMSRNLPIDAVLFDLDSVLPSMPSETGASFNPAVDAALDALRQMGLKLGVVTDKATRFVEPLLQRSGVSMWFDIVVDGDTLAHCKPHPAPLLHACEALAVAPAHALFVGGSENDALTAQAAGMPMICLSDGEIDNYDVAGLPCLSVIEALAELPMLIGGPQQWHRAKRSARAEPRSDDSGGLYI